MKSIFLLYILSISLFSSCIKNSSDCPRKFIIPAEIMPYSDTYKIGDTLTITSIFDKFVFDQQTEKEYNMENINWNPLLIIHKIDTNIQDSQNLQYSTNKYVDYLFEDNEYDLHWFLYSSGGASLDGQFNFVNDTFKIEIKIIPKLKGTYFLKFGSGLFMSTQEFEGKCKYTDFDVYTDMNGDKDNNIDLLKESTNPHYNDWILQKPDERFDRGGGYCYKVVE